MDKESQERFDKIVRMEPAALTPGDVEFLNARKSYLNAADLQRFAEVLGEAPDEPDEDDYATPEPATPAKSKKK